MIVVRVELWSAVTGQRTELARMRISNDGQASTADPSRGCYLGETLKGRSASALDRGEIQRRGRVNNFRRNDLHVWNLVAQMLGRMGYGREPTAAKPDLFASSDRG